MGHVNILSLWSWLYCNWRQATKQLEAIDVKTYNNNNNNDNNNNNNNDKGYSLKKNCQHQLDVC